MKSVGRCGVSLVLGLMAQQAAPALEAFQDAFKKVLPQAGAPSSAPSTQAPASRASAPTPAVAASSEPFSMDEPKVPPTGKLGDYKAMPSVVGINLGMPLGQAIAALRATYKGAVQLGVASQWPGYDQRALVEFGVGINVVGHQPETLYVEATAPPQEQRIWRVNRRAGDANHKSLRSELLAGLRQKYGKETVAFHTSDLGTEASGLDPHSDAQIGVLWWLFDEQGRPARLPAGGVEQVRSNGCLGLFMDVPRSAGIFPSFQTDADTVPIVSEGYCTSSLVIVRAAIGLEPTVGAFWVDMLEVPLAARAARATLAMVNGDALKQQQDEIQKAKANRPKL